MPAPQFKIRLSGPSFQVANRRHVEVGDKVVGFILISRGHNFGGRGTAYLFHPNEHGEAIGLKSFSTTHVRRVKDMIDSLLFKAWKDR